METRISFALQAVGPEPETVLPEVVPGEKAQTAHEDEQRDGPPDQRVAYIAGQGGVGSAGPHQVKVALQKAEMEWKIPYHSPRSRPSWGQKREGQKERAGPLMSSMAFQNKAGHAYDPHLGGGDGLLHHPALPQADSPAGAHDHGHSHVTTPMPPVWIRTRRGPGGRRGPVGGGVSWTYQPGDTGGGGGGEQRVGEGVNTLPGWRRAA